MSKNQIKIVDVCTILAKCSINEISDYLLKIESKKNFPDIDYSLLKTYGQ